MKNRKFSDELSRRLGYSAGDTAYLLDVVTSTIVKGVQEGYVVSIAEFGIFERIKRTERLVLNPKTQERILLPPKLVVNYKPINILKDKLKENK